MSVRSRPMPRPLDPAKFRDLRLTAKGEPRASVGLEALRTLWFNTGTLCNITCQHCYIESSPRNDRLIYLSAEEVAAFLDEAEALGAPVETVGFTGGEPFMNRALPTMLADVLSRPRRLIAIVLTNAMAPLWQKRAALLALRDRFGAERLILRVSLDHYSAEHHDLERGLGSFAKSMQGLAWLAREGFTVHVAGRAGFTEETEDALREGFRRLFAEHAIPIDAEDPIALTLFPEMDPTIDVPEITQACWSILGKSPTSVMCATSRMVVKRKGAERPVVVACTLLPYDPNFELGATLADASGPVPLNHPHCAKFCVLGGGACSR